MSQRQVVQESDVVIFSVKPQVGKFSVCLSGFTPFCNFSASFSSCTSTLFTMDSVMTKLRGCFLAVRIRMSKLHINELHVDKRYLADLCFHQVLHLDHVT